MRVSQSSSAVLMVYPTTFGFNEETAETNTFQHQTAGHASKTAVTKQAATEFNDFVEKLRTHDISVTVFHDPRSGTRPDAVFPNNWITTWPDGHIYMYPMQAQDRRAERTPLVVKQLETHFSVSRVTDLSVSEEANIYLEGTGAIVYDHPNRTAYGCISPRCDAQLFRHHAKALGYQAILVHAFDTGQTPIYHTNVLMGIQSHTAVVCAEAVTNPAERATLLESLYTTGHEVIEITLKQLGQFCGNLLEVRNKAGKRFVILSQTAYDAFTPAQRKTLSQSGTLLPIAIPTIETIAGGSVRCMLAEVFLPRRAASRTAHKSSAQ